MRKTDICGENRDWALRNYFDLLGTCPKGFEFGGSSDQTLIDLLDFPLVIKAQGWLILNGSPYSLISLGFQADQSQSLS